MATVASLVVEGRFDPAQIQRGVEEAVQALQSLQSRVAAIGQTPLPGVGGADAAQSAQQVQQVTQQVQALGSAAQPAAEAAAALNASLGQSQQAAQQAAAGFDATVSSLRQIAASIQNANGASAELFAPLVQSVTVLTNSFQAGEFGAAAYGTGLEVVQERAQALLDQGLIPTTRQMEILNAAFGTSGQLGAALGQMTAQADAAAAALGNTGSSAAKLGTTASGGGVNGLNILRRGLFALDASALGASSSLGNVGAGILLLGADLPIVLALGAAVGVFALAWDAANAATAKQDKELEQVVTQLDRAQQTARDRTPLGMQLEVDKLNEGLAQAQAHLTFLQHLTAQDNPAAPFLAPFITFFGFIDRAQAKVNDLRNAESAEQQARRTANTDAANADAAQQAEVIASELALAQSRNARLAALNDASFRADTESLVTFYAKRLALTRQAVAAEIAAQQKTISVISLRVIDPTGPNVASQQDQRNKDLIAAQQRLNQIQVDGGTEVIRLLAEEAAARHDLALQRLTFEGQIAGAQGQTHEQALAQIQAQTDAFARFLRVSRPGISDAELTSSVTDFSNALLLQADVQEKLRVSGRDLADIERQRTGIQDQLTNGSIGEAEAAIEQANVVRATLASMEDQLAVLTQQAGKNSVLLDQAKQLGAQIDTLRAGVVGIPSDVGIQVRVIAFEETSQEVERLKAELSTLPAGSPLIDTLTRDLGNARTSLQSLQRDLVNTASAAVTAGTITSTEFARILVLVQKLHAETQGWLGALRGIAAAAQGLESIAGAFGSIDAATRQALDGVQQLTQGIATFKQALPANGIGGSFAGIAGGIFAGVAALGSIGAALFGGGPSETDILLKEANDHLADMELALNLQLQTSDGILAAQRAVVGLSAPDSAKRLAALSGIGVFDGEGALKQEKAFVNATLAGSGLDFDTLVALAKKEGIPILNSDGLIDPALLEPFAHALGLTSDQMKQLAETTGQLNDAMLNVPTGFRIKAAEFAAQTPVDVDTITKAISTGLSVDPARAPISVGTGGSLVTINIQGSTGALTPAQITQATVAGIRAASRAQTGDTRQALDLN